MGAAKANGSAWGWTGDPENVDFLLPGHEVSDRGDDGIDEALKPHTGSSVATALAAGLAALIIHCVRLGAIYTALTPGWKDLAGAVTDKDLKRVKQHDNMRNVLMDIGTSKATKDKFIEVWKCFEGPASELKDEERRAKTVITLAQQFARAAGR